MRFFRVVFLILITEAPPKALDINVESSAELNSVLGSVGKVNSIKKPLCASPLEASLIFSILTLLAVRIPESVTNSIMLESTFLDVKRVCAAAIVACPQRSTCHK